MNELKKWLRHRLGRHCSSLLELYYFCRYWFLYRGEPFVCPCCSARLSRFLRMTTLLGSKHESVICPRCDSHPRHRLLWLFLNERCRDLFDRRLNLLHLAPEFCFERHFRRSPNLQYVTADLISPQVDCRVDVCRLPFMKDQFDVILCNHVLEHVSADRKAMSELFRILRPGGWALMQVPLDSNREVTLEDPEVISPEERERYYGQDDHVRLYGLDFIERVKQAGFYVEVIDFVATQEPRLIERHGLHSHELIYLCRKRAGQQAVEE